MKKFLTSLLCVVLIVCFMPAMAWAGSDAPCDDGDGCQHAAAIITEAGTTTHYDTLQEAITASNSGDKIQLLKDIDNSIYAEGYTGALSFELKENTTLDGNEHKISGHVGIRIPAQGATVQNINFENIHNGVVVDEATCKYYGWENKTGNQSAIYASSLTGTATITGCTFDNIDWDAIQITPKAETSKIIIKDNTFKHTDENSTQLRYIHIEDIRYAYIGSKVAEVTITDNQFYKSKNSYETCSIGTWYISASKTPEVKINGNYIEDLNSTEVSRLDIKNLYPARSNPDVDVDDLNPAAYYSSNVYMTLQDAIDKGENYIYLMQDNTENVNIPEGRTISLFSGSYKLDGMITNNGGLTVGSGTNTQGNATVTNNGVLTLSCDAAASYDVINTNNGTLKITGGETYDLSKIQNSGSVEISGGTFTTKPDDGLLCEWYLAKELENGSYKVSKMTIEEGLEKGLAASTVAGAFYKSVNEAVVGSPGNIYLQKDSSEDVVFNAGNATRSLYLNGKDFTGSIQISDPCDAVRLCGSSAELSNVTGKTLYIGSYNTEAQVTIRNADLETLNVAASGQCNVKGGTYKNVITNIYYEKNAETPKYEASLQITGGTFASNTVTVSYVNHTLCLLYTSRCV